MFLRKLYLCVAGLCFFLLPLYSLGLVRYGNFLHVGSLVFRYVPNSMQTDRLSEQTDGLFSIHVQDFMTHVGMERLTFSSDLTSVWNSSVNIGSLDSSVLHNDIYYQYSPNFSFGVGLTNVWLNDHHCAVESSYKSGSQLGFLVRWRW